MVFWDKAHSSSSARSALSRSRRRLLSVCSRSERGRRVEVDGETNGRELRGQVHLLVVEPERSSWCPGWWTRRTARGNVHAQRRDTGRQADCWSLHGHDGRPQQGLSECESNIFKLRQKYIYAQNPISEELWTEESERLGRQLREVQHELALLQELGHQDESRLIDFAERLFRQAADVCSAATPDQRERLQAAYFPEGLSYDSGEFRTARMRIFFNELRSTDEKIGGMASPAGFADIHTMVGAARVA